MQSKEKVKIGKVIRRLRLERGLSLEEVALHCDEDSNFIREIEVEKHQDLGLTTLYLIAKKFDMKLWELFKEIEEDNKVL
ncbi:helix-turn-helix transcriptional regulator [Neobacillus sp. FSL H8-0543]|uniref:helix-turn-helix domain-containing protein n=1 Tax=Neobacillus sp. FSL H8-0543 TaxID=2954672 RepID=UPI00315974CF